MTNPNINTETRQSKKGAEHDKDTPAISSQEAAKMASSDEEE
ncbi:hypothetical protein [Robiginitomaculum antarcticum]|nr:hypothetical protein [Robiginitomaculum antarcticum]